MKFARILPLCVILVVTGCQVSTETAQTQPNGSASQPIASAKPSNAKVERRDLVGYRLLPAKLYTPPSEQSKVFATYSTTIEKVLTSEGQRVRRGEVLIVLAMPVEQSYFDQARAQLNAAEAAYKSAVAQYGTAASKARQQLKLAQEAERSARSATMPGGDATALQSATEARQIAQDAVRQAEAQESIDILPYKQQLNFARDAFEDAKSGVKQASVRAPLSGVVTKLAAKQGQNVSAGSELGEVVDLSALKVKATATAKDSELVKEGAVVVIVFNEFPDKHFHGKVTSVQPLPSGENGKVVHEATIWFDNENGDVKPGMVVKSAGIETGKAEDALTVPLDAVAKDETGKPVVRKLDGTDWTSVVVELGLTDGTYIQIKSGDLKVDDTVQVMPGQGAWIASGT